MNSKVLIGGKPDQIRNYVKALEQVQVEGISVYACPWQEAIDCLGLILPGGGDIAPDIFGQENHGSVHIDEALDRLQLKLLGEYIKAGKPVLGICKGIQIINVFFGGTIQQHLPTAHAHSYQEADQYHMTIAKRGTVLEHLYGLRFPVNSAHHQGIDQLGRDLEAIQFAEDQVIEGIVHKELPILGVQWHPERMMGYSENYVDGKRLFQFWIQLFPKKKGCDTMNA